MACGTSRSRLGSDESFCGQSECGSEASVATSGGSSVMGVNIDFGADYFNEEAPQERLINADDATPREADRKMPSVGAYGAGMRGSQVARASELIPSGSQERPVGQTA